MPHPDCAAPSACYIERIASASGAGMLAVRDGRVAFLNGAARHLLGLTDTATDADVLSESVVLEVIEGTILPEVPITLGDLLQAAAPFAAVARVQRSDGRRIALTMEAGTLEGAHGATFYLSFRTAGRAVSQSRELSISRAQFGALADHTPVAVCVSEVGSRIGYANDRMAAVWGCSPDELLGTNWLEAVVEADRGHVKAALSHVLAGDEVELVMSIERPDKTRRMLECRFAPVAREDRSVGFVGTAADITDHQERQAQLEWHASHDVLTGLANRQGLQERCREAAALRQPSAIVFLDLDDFKLVNDGLGHPAGDELLRIVAARLVAASGADDTVVRLGGDEFVVVTRGTSDGGATRLARRLLDRINEPVSLQGRVVHVTASIGVVEGSAEAQGADELLRDADIAMYQAKRAGKGRVASFTPATRDAASTRFEILADLRAAIAEDRFELEFQPIVELGTGAIVGAEALLRYAHPALGPMSPLDVVDVAEMSGLYTMLGAAILHRSLSAVRVWIDETDGGELPYVTVNVSANQLLDDGFGERVRDAVQAADVPPACLVLELTESQMMRDIDRAATVLREVSQAGIRIAIDDFGTGYSSLAYLARLPFDIIKIDRSFVETYPLSLATVAVVQACTALTRTLGGQVLVEGIEDERTLASVAQLNCSLAQGYLFARPVPADVLAGMLRESCAALARADA